MMHCDNTKTKLLNQNMNRLNSNSNSRSPSPATSSCSFKNPLNISTPPHHQQQQQQSHHQQQQFHQKSPNVFSAPYPPSNASSIYSMNAPVTCEAKQLNKLKRFLTTIQQFANDVSPEVGERVRNLVLNLVNATLVIEDFHTLLHEATKFPLRPFVIPFLKASLPLLQRELSYLSRLEKQNFLPSSGNLYEQLNLSLSINNTSTTSLSPFIHVTSASSPKGPLVNNENYYNHLNAHHLNNNNNKRKSPCDSSAQPPVKRNAHSPSLNTHDQFTSNKIQIQPHNFPFASTHLNLDDINFWRELREKERFFANYIKDFEQDYRELFDRNFEDDYKNIDSVLNCFTDLIDKTKRGMSMLHSKTLQLRKQVETYETEIKRKHCELLAQTMKQTEERVNEIRKRAEDAVNEVKRQAAVELQKAIQAAELKANELVKKEHDHFELLHKQEDSIENCWNCGRKAYDTCTQCTQAKYCSTFCRQKHWQNGHSQICCSKPPNVESSELDISIESKQNLNLTTSLSSSSSNSAS